VRNLAGSGPLCVVVDDAHWADAASLRYLGFLLTRLEELNVALVAATRPSEEGTYAELLTTVTTDPSADVIRLAPLTKGAVVQLLEAGLGRPPDPVVVDTCLRVTRGMPFLVRELVTALSEGDIGSGVETVARSVRLRLDRLPEASGRLARALAVLE
jgi:predicted ATPase